MKSEGYAPNNFPFQAFVHKLYMVITAKKKSKNRVADPTKNNPYLSQKTEKNGGHCTCPLIKKNVSSSIYSSFEYHLRNPA